MIQKWRTKIDENWDGRWWKLIPSEIKDWSIKFKYLSKTWWGIPPSGKTVWIISPCWATIQDHPAGFQCVLPGTL
jgi:hypothetical protein